MTIQLHGISRAAFDLIVAEEVTSATYYSAHYRHPTWPGERSGVTIGIGYDVGQNSKAQVLADWSGKLPDAMVKALAKTAGVTGAAAAPLARSLRAIVDVPWDAALDVFSNHDVPRYLALLRHACPGVDSLSPDCEGVLLSITFNRGPSFNTPGVRYAEMRGIRDAVKAGNYARIPGLIRSMKRLWPTTSGLRGRREREAVLFEKGLQAAHPAHFAALADTPAPDNPELVAHVQGQLRDTGYYQVGEVDGSLTPKGKTEDAILAFRNKNDLPLTPTIDDDLLTHLAKAQPPEPAEERATATADDLRAKGSETIGMTDQIKAWGGRLFGTGSSLGGAGLLAWFSDKASAVSGAKDAVTGLGIGPQGWLMIGAAIVAFLALAGMGLLIWYIAHKLEEHRVDTYRTGQHP